MSAASTAASVTTTSAVATATAWMSTAWTIHRRGDATGVTAWASHPDGRFPDVHRGARPLRHVRRAANHAIQRHHPSPSLGHG
jgi:hypothetical protein